MKKAYIFLAEGFEEVEAVTPLDLLRRAGIDAKFISISNERAVVGAHKITYLADEIFDNVDFSDGDAFILPGGMPGTTNLNAFDELTSLIKSKFEDGKLVAAICAAPTILWKLGILAGIETAVYPSYEGKLDGTITNGKKVCSYNNIITGNALGSAIDFSLEIINYLMSEDKKMSLKNEIVY
ncbi:MAG: DJ-1 family glyoxalase III [Clostridia bacterium]